MGYNIRISRAADEPGKESPGIFLKEWLSYVNSDKELELATGFEIRIGAETQFQNRPGFCEWNAHPTETEVNARPWFAYWKGSIDTKNPGIATIQKMLQIATALKARVQGDDGEIYDEKYLLKLESAEKQKIAPSPVLENKRPWWKFW